LVETPVFFSTLSARVNLQLLAEIAGLGNHRVDEVLDLVGLSDRARDKVKGYSLGMRQRLASLLRCSRTRGSSFSTAQQRLDPAAFARSENSSARWARAARRSSSRATCFAEVQQVCDHMAILSHGRCIVTGRTSDVLSAALQGKCGCAWQISPRCDSANGRWSHVTKADDALTVTGAADPADITKLLAAKKLYVSELTSVTADLETVFLDLTADA